MIVGTAGHVDHGKTALVRALTGVDTDRLKEEKARGITIDLGFAYMALEGGGTIGFVDVPGHERLVRTMVAGAAGIDFALLVIAADDGIMPQTREHLEILGLLGLTRGLVAVTKCDRVDAARRAAVADEIAAALAGTPFADAEPAFVSARDGEGIDALRRRLAAEAAAAGAGPRAAGCSACRSTAPSRWAASARWSPARRCRAGCASATRSPCCPAAAAPACARFTRATARRRRAPPASAWRWLSPAPGSTGTRRRAAPGSAPAPNPPSPRASMPTCACSEARRGPCATARRCISTSAPATGSRAWWCWRDAGRPGCRAPVQIVLDAPLPLRHGDLFVLRDASAQRTIGGGRVLDPRAPLRRRRSPERLARLDALRPADPAEALGRLLALAPGLEDLAAFRADRGLTETEAAALRTTLGLELLQDGPAAFVATAAGWAELRGRV